MGIRLVSVEHYLSSALWDEELRNLASTKKGVERINFFVWPSPITLTQDSLFSSQQLFKEMCLSEFQPGCFHPEFTPNCMCGFNRFCTDGDKPSDASLLNNYTRMTRRLSIKPFLEGRQLGQSNCRKQSPRLKATAQWLLCNFEMIVLSANPSLSPFAADSLDALGLSKNEPAVILTVR